MNSLNAAIENLYAAFGDVPKPTRIEGCPCCINEQEIQFLLHKPLRELAEANLNGYLSSALYTVGTWEDFLYFLPRLLELTVLGKFGWTEPGIVLRRIHYAKDEGHHLSESQHHAVQLLLQSWWTEFLARENEPDSFGVDAVLCALLDEKFPLFELLNVWEHHASIRAADHLADYIQFNINWLAMGKMLARHTADESLVARAIYAWLVSDPVKKKLEEAFFKDPDRPSAQAISNALLYLEATV